MTDTALAARDLPHPSDDARSPLRSAPPRPTHQTWDDSVGERTAGGDDPPALTARFEEYRRTGDRRLRNELVEDNRSLAQALARRYANRGEPLDDLEQAAMLGLVKAVQRFDPRQGIPFAGYAVPTITGELRRHFRDQTWAVKVHRQAKDLNVRLPAVADRMTGELGRVPTPTELAEVLECSVDVVIDALDAGIAYRPTSSDTVEGAAAAASARTASAEGTELEPEDRLLLAGLLAELPERERTILVLRYFEELTQSEIAARLGISQVHVSRLIRSALAQARSAAG